MNWLDLGTFNLYEYDYWNISKNGFGTVSVCYYDRSSPLFIIEDEFISDEHSKLVAKTNKENL